eukprot:395809-Rhodomonas_salina.1
MPRYHERYWDTPVHGHARHRIRRASRCYAGRVASYTVSVPRGAAPLGRSLAPAAFATVGPATRPPVTSQPATRPPVTSRHTTVTVQPRATFAGHVKVSRHDDRPRHSLQRSRHSLQRSRHSLQ